MAAPSYATDLSDIIVEMASTTGWTLISSGGGGANSLTAPETDDFIQGNNCISRNPWTSANIRGMVYNATATIATDDAVYIWAKSDVTQALDTKANGGLQVVMGDSPTTLDCFYVDGSDTAVKGGWRLYAVDPTATPSTTVGGGSGGTNDEWGFRWSVPTSGPNKGFPYKIDAIRHGRSVDVTGGDSGAGGPATWDLLAAHADAGARRWGVVQQTDTGAAVVGIVNWGTASAAVYSRDAGRTIVLPVTSGFVATDFTQLVFANASTDVIWTSITVEALDTANRGLIDINTTDNPSVVFASCRFVGMDTFSAGGTNTDFTDCTFDSCNELTARGGSLVGSSFLTPTVAADSAAVIYNETADPDGEFDDTTFTKGTNDHHAIEFGTSAPTTMTLRGVTVSGFSGTGNAATLNFLRTTGTTTVNLVGCSGTFTAKVTGSHTVTFVVDPVTTTIVVRDENGDPLAGARVLVEPSSDAGNTTVPYQDTVTLTRSGTTVTVSHTGHGLATNQWVLIEGANEWGYNGVWQVTVSDANTYTYTSNTTPSASPATGTPIATGIIIYGETTGSGTLTDNRSYDTADQPVKGTVHKSSAAPFYKRFTFSGDIDTAAGFSQTVRLIPDA